MNIRLAAEHARKSAPRKTPPRSTFFTRARRAFLSLSRRQRLYVVAFFGAIVLFAVVVAVLLFNLLSSGSTERIESPSPLTEHVNPTTIDLSHSFLGSYGQVFDDLNALHIAAAKSYGIRPEEIDFATEEGRQGMLHVQSDSLMKIDRLTHSEPYLVYEAYALLHDVAHDFARRLDHFEVPRHRLIVTSLTRSEKQRAALARVNSNAAETSAHCFGTTFDISWSRFAPLTEISISDATLKKHLAAVLVQYQQAGRCYVKHERRQACFHITVAERRASFSTPVEKAASSTERFLHP